MDDFSNNLRQVGEPKPGGILRVDISKPRRSSGSSVEFRQPERLGQGLNDGIGPASPEPSVDRLSVTWADTEDTSTRINLFTPGTPPANKMEVRFPVNGADGSEDEDYSASVSAIMQRRASTRRSKKGSRGRRPSSPFSLEPRRRSSVFTTSSAETAISIEDSHQEVTQEQIFENIRLHKEVLSSVKQQPWGMKRKLRLVNQAKSYIKRHEGALQERLAQSKCTRDIVARFNILLATKLQMLKREAANWSNWFIPWELRIKEIESHFGSVVASYFTFLRWLFWVNLVISIVLVVFVVVPEVLTADPNAAGERKKMLPEERNKSTNLLTLWEFEGILKYSPIFYGYYTNRDPGENGGYRLPLAYFMTGLAVYVYSFFATLRKMAENSRMSKLSEKEDECIFSWKLFTGWDYMIGNAETSHNRTASIILGFKEALLEEAEKKKDLRNWKIIFQRIAVNICVMFLLGVSAYAVVEVVRRSNEPNIDTGNLWRQNEITIVMSLISFIFPIFFELLGLFENYHPRKQLRIQLARIMVLNLLNLYSLIIALFDKITDMTIALQRLKPNETSTLSPIISSSTVILPLITTINSETTEYSTISSTPYDTTTGYPIENITSCSMERIPCTTTVAVKNITATLMTIMFANATSQYSSTSQNFNESTFSPSTQILNMNTTGFSTADFFSNEFSITEPTTTSQDAMFNYTFSSYESTSQIIDFDMETKSTTDISINELISSMYSISIGTNDDKTHNYDDDDGDYEYYADDPNALYDKDNDSSTTYPSEFSSMKYNSTPLYTLEDTEKSSTSYDDISTSETYELSNASFTTVESTEDSNYSRTEPSYENDCFVMKCVNVLEQKTSLQQKDETTEIPERLMDATHMAHIQRDYQFGKSPSQVLDTETRKKLRKLCWETMFGQELVKLTMMDLVLTILATLCMDFFRAVFVRFMNSCWCWDLEKKFPQYGDFKIAENILHLVNNQGMVWMGMFFSPGLVVLNLIKLVILMYLRSWIVMTCNVPHEIVFRASRSNNFYLALLLTMLFLCVLPVGYAIVWVEPSWHCGPFSNYQRIYHLFTQSLLKLLPAPFHRALDYIASPGIVIPLLVLLTLIIYYLLSLTGALREANNDLKIQLRRERTEERRKMFQIADKRRRGGSNDSENTPFSKWKKILPVMPSNNKADIKHDENRHNDNDNDKYPVEKKDLLLAKIVKLALRKSSGTSDDESGLAVPAADDETDTEFHESLPEDVLTVKDIKFTQKSKSTSKTQNSAPAHLKNKTHDQEHHKSRHKTENKEHRSLHKINDIEPEVEKRPANLILENEVTTKTKRKKHDHKNSKSTKPDSDPNIGKGEKRQDREVESPKDEKKIKTKVSSHKTNDVKSVELSEQNIALMKRRRSKSISIENREDSITSIIPVITISKTESDEDILDKDGKSNKERKHKKLEESDLKGNDSDNLTGNSSKILKRQSSVESMKTSMKNDQFKTEKTTRTEEPTKKVTVKSDFCRSLLKAAKDWREEQDKAENNTSYNNQKEAKEKANKHQKSESRKAPAEHVDTPNPKM